MVWDYRVTRETVSGETFYVIREVYYERNNRVSWTEKACHPLGETAEDLKQDIGLMLKAFEHPVLDIDELEKEYAEDSV